MDTKKFIKKKGFIVAGSTAFAVILIKLFMASISVIYPSKEPFYVRVKVAGNVPEIVLSSSRKCSVIDETTGKTVLDNVKLNDLEIEYADNGIKAGNARFSGSDRILIRSDNSSNVIMIGKKRYGGELVVRRKSGGLLAVNRIELEEYLKGVIPREVNHLWPFETLKAQAIASRSYAVNIALKRKKLAYDLRDDTFSQVYGGRGAEKWRTNKAVEATRGRVLVYGGKVLQAFFHSCCGGHTENMATVWGESLRPLEGVRCSWCKWSPHYRWKTRVSSSKISEALAAAGYDNNKIDDVKEGMRDASGRLEYVSVKCGNKWFDIRTPQFARALGAKVIKSTKMRIDKYPFFYRFTGYGWGHGVGMCQWGAFWLGMRWKNAEYILSVYYPGAEIIQLSEVIN